MKSYFWLVVAAGLAAGCSTPRLPELGARYTPSNVHAVEILPKSIRRVALLPLAPHRSGSVLATGAEDLAGVVETELRQSGTFEVVTVPEKELQLWTGRANWRADEALPADFFERMIEHTGCDSILFPVLTSFHPYPPLLLGLDLRLIDCADHRTLWAVDEVLNAGAEPVARAARDYARAQARVLEEEDGSVLQSPSRFARFASATLFHTLPGREYALKKKPRATITGAQPQP